MQTTDISILEKDYLLKALRRELARTPAGVALDLTRAARTKQPPAESVALSTQTLGFFFDASEASQENIEFLNSILKGMNIEFSKVLMTSRFEDFHSGIQNMICFGAAAPQNVSGPYKIFESLSPSQLKTNVSEKKKLWNQLKAWTPHL